MPAGPVHPVRNDVVYESAKMQSESRASAQYAHTIPCTLPDKVRDSVCLFEFFDPKLP
jgi:hypothetical protein